MPVVVCGRHKLLVTRAPDCVTNDCFRTPFAMQLRDEQVRQGHHEQHNAGTRMSWP